MFRCMFILLMMTISLPSFATDVTGGETCDTDVLNTDTGPVNLRAEFEPETIDLYWYNDNNPITVPTVSNSCTYDTPINLPPNPVKPGYKFRGWKVFNILTTLDTSINILHWDSDGLRWKPIIPNGYTMSDVFGSENSNDLENGEWTVTFEYGTVSGKSLCSTTTGTGHEPGSPNNSETGRYCWCIATKFNNIPVSLSNWVFRHNYEAASNCVYGCTFQCANFVAIHDYFRNPLYGQSNN